MNIYFISGLGADRHAFDRIKLSEQYSIHHLDWLEPEPNESLSHYVQRMRASIDISKPFALVGLSFGGIIAMEIQKNTKPEIVFVISSITQHQQLPWYLRWAGNLQLHRIGFVFFLRRIPQFTNWIFGVHTPNMKKYLQDMIAKTTNNYLTWSMNAILSWQQKEKPPHVIHIHGNKDLLFTKVHHEADYVVHNGSHFAILTHAKTISSIIEKELQKITSS